MRSIFIALLVACLATVASAQTDPPFGGTIFIDPDIITPDDATTFQSVSDAGAGSRTMFDRRVNGWITVNAFLFDAAFDDGLSIEIQVNPEFASTDSARAQAMKYAPVIGQLPTALRADVETVWIHGGVQPFGGGNNNLLIHIGQADLYVADGILEETLVHEAAHTSLDGAHAAAPGWIAAQAADPTFISTYARDFPNREDIAESFLPYLAVRHRADRISEGLETTIMQTIPNRIAYFDDQAFDMHPIVKKSVANEEDGTFPSKFRLGLNFPNPFRSRTTLIYELREATDIDLVVLDVHGRVIASLVNGLESVGRHQVVWDAKGTPGGVYFVRLRAGGATDVQRILLVR